MMEILVYAGGALTLAFLGGALWFGDKLLKPVFLAKFLGFLCVVAAVVALALAVVWTYRAGYMDGCNDVLGPEQPPQQQQGENQI